MIVCAPLLEMADAKLNASRCTTMDNGRSNRISSRAHYTINSLFDNAGRAGKRG